MTKPEETPDVFAVLEDGLDVAIDRFQEASKSASGPMHIDRDSARSLTARLIAVNAKLVGLQRFAAFALRGVSAAREAVGDPITEDEIRTATPAVVDGPFPLPVPEGQAPPADDIMKPVDVARPPRSVVAPDGKLWN